MTEPDVLRRNIQALQELQRAAWFQLADPALTTFERRETRNQIKQTGAELRSCLEMMSERTRFRPRPVEEDAIESLGKFEFRLLATQISSDRTLEFEGVTRSGGSPLYIGC